MPRTPEQNREYMRKYRARRRGQVVTLGEFVDDLAAARIAELEEEVRHLKEELAKRPFTVEADGVRRYRPRGVAGRHPIAEWDDTHDFNTRPFSPQPKKRR